MSFNLNELMAQAQRIQEQMVKTKAELKNKTVTAKVQEGAIKIICNGQQEILGIELDPAVFPLKNRKELENLLVEGINQALANAKGMVQEEITKLTGGMNLPGLKDFL